MENLHNIVGYIDFVVILDNSGKRIYSKYFGKNEMEKFERQKELEEKIANTVITYNINKNNESIFFLF
jgi:sensor domain CHASE-containing protein